MSYSHSRKPDLLVTDSSPFITWVNVLFFFFSFEKNSQGSRIMGFGGGDGIIAIATAQPPSTFVYCIVNIK